MNKQKFRKPPKTLEEKESIEDQFIKGADHVQDNDKTIKTKSLLLRMPEPLWRDLKKLAFTKDTSMTSICIDIIRKKISKELNN